MTIRSIVSAVSATYSSAPAHADGSNGSVVISLSYRPAAPRSSPARPRGLPHPPPAPPLPAPGPSTPAPPAGGGRAGPRLAERLGMNTSRDTLLRRLKEVAPAEAVVPRVLGVDDWAKRKGQ